MYQILSIYIAGALAVTAVAQTRIDLRTQAKNIDFTAANVTKPVRMGSALPSTCAAGELFFLTGASAGTSLYACQVINVWSAVGAESCQLTSGGTALLCQDSAGNTTQVTAVSVGALADPQANGVPYRSGNGMTQPASASQLSGPFGCQDTGTLNGYACNLSPAIASYTAGASYWFQAGSTNTAAVTVNFNGLGPRAILKPYNQPLTGGEIHSGQWVVLTYDGYAMQMQSPPANAVFSFAGRSGAITPASGDYTTAQVTESGNLYFTNARAQAAYSFPGVVQSIGGSINCPSCITTATQADTDLSGSFPHLSVAKLQGNKLSSAAPADQQYLGWSNAAGQWQPTSLPAPAVPSVFGRSGAVTPQSGDYSFAQISGSVSAAQLPAAAMLTNQSNTITAGTQNFSSAAHTLPMKSGLLAGLPSTCSPGETYFATDAAQGANVYGCTATNTWSAEGTAYTFPGVVQAAGNSINCPSCITTATQADTDLSGSFPHLSVAKLQGNKLSSAAPADQQYLGWSNAAGQWQPTSLPAPAVPSVFGRSGAVTAQSGDYSFAQISGSVSAAQLPAAAMLTNQSNTITAGTQNFSSAAHTLPMKSGLLAGTPSTCSPGETYFATDAAQGANVYGCTAANTWAPQGSTISFQSDGSPIGSRAVANFMTGPGLISVITDTGTAIDIQTGLDTAVVQTQSGEQSGTALLCASASNSSTSYQCSLSPTATVYTAGMILHWTPDVNGAGGATTLNVDTLGVIPIKLADGTSNPGTSDIIAGRMYGIWYDGTSFRLPATTTTWTASGDISGSASGTTSISPSLTVAGLKGAVLPPLTTGNLRYSSGAWNFDPTTYLTANQTIAASGDCTGSGSISLSLTCGKTGGVAFAASATTDTTNANNIASGTLNHARLPGLLSADIPNSPSLGAGSSPVTQTWTVGAGGVAANTLVQTDTSVPLKIVAATTGVYGVAMSTVAATGSVEVARFGTVNCITDTGGATAGDLVIIGTGSTINCKDSGQTSSGLISQAVRIVGVFRSTVTAGNPALVELTPSHFGTLVPESNGGTGANNTVGAAGHVLRSNGTHYVDSAIQASDVPTLNQNTSGSAATATNMSGGAMGALPYQSGTNTSAFLSGNTAATDQVLVSHGTGSAAQAPTLSNAPALSAANMTNIPASVDAPSAALCFTAGCGAETTPNNWFVLNPSGITWHTCGANLAVAPSGSTVTVQLQTSTGTPVATINLTTANGTATVFTSSFSPTTAAQGAQFRFAVTANDSGNTAQFLYVRCY